MQGGQAELVRELRAHGVAQTVAFSPDGIHVATASYNSSAKLWTLATGSLVKTLISHSKEVRGVGFSKEGKLLITASDDKSAKLWEVSSGKVLLSLDGNHAGGVCCAVLSPLFATQYFDSDTSSARPAMSAGEREASLVLTSSVDKTAKVWTSKAPARHSVTGTGASDRWDVKCTLVGHTDRVGGCAISADGQLALTASSDRTARIWTLHTGTPLHVLKGHTDDVLSCAFAPSGLLALTAGADRTARLHDASSGEERFSVDTRSRVYAVAFSADGRRFGTAGQEAVQLWDAGSGGLVGALPARQSAAYAIAFSAGAGAGAGGGAAGNGGGSIVAVSRGTTTELWDVSSLTGGGGGGSGGNGRLPARSPGLGGQAFNAAASLSSVPSASAASASAAASAAGKARPATIGRLESEVEALRAERDALREQTNQAAAAASAARADAAAAASGAREGGGASNTVPTQGSSRIAAAAATYGGLSGGVQARVKSGALASNGHHASGGSGQAPSTVHASTYAPPSNGTDNTDKAGSRQNGVQAGGGHGGVRGSAQGSAQSERLESEVVQLRFERSELREQARKALADANAARAEAAASRAQLERERRALQAERELRARAAEEAEQAEAALRAELEATAQRAAEAERATAQLRAATPERSSSSYGRTAPAGAHGAGGGIFGAGVGHVSERQKRRHSGAGMEAHRATAAEARELGQAGNGEAQRLSSARPAGSSAHTAGASAQLSRQASSASAMATGGSGAGGAGGGVGEGVAHHSGGTSPSASRGASRSGSSLRGGGGSGRPDGRGTFDGARRQAGKEGKAAAGEGLRGEADKAYAAVDPVLLANALRAASPVSSRAGSFSRRAGASKERGGTGVSAAVSNGNSAGGCDGGGGGGSYAANIGGGADSGREGTRAQRGYYSARANPPLSLRSTAADQTAHRSQRASASAVAREESDPAATSPAPRHGGGAHGNGPSPAPPWSQTAPHVARAHARTPASPPGPSSALPPQPFVTMRAKGAVRSAGGPSGRADGTGAGAGSTSAHERAPFASGASPQRLQRGATVESTAWARNYGQDGNGASGSAARRASATAATTANQAGGGGGARVERGTAQGGEQGATSWHSYLGERQVPAADGLPQQRRVGSSSALRGAQGSESAVEAEVAWFRAAAHGRTGELERLWKGRPELLLLRSHDRRGHTALHVAAAHGQRTCVHWLLARDPGLVDVLSHNQETALHLAAEQGATAVLETLLLAGCDLGAKDREGRTARQRAQLRGHTRVVEELDPFH